jgi:hypothetical protein
MSSNEEDSLHAKDTAFARTSEGGSTAVTDPNEIELLSEN